MSEQRTTGSGGEDGPLQGAKAAPGGGAGPGRMKNKTVGAGPSSAPDGHVNIAKAGRGLPIKGAAGPKVVTGDGPANGGGGVTGFTGS